MNEFHKDGRGRQFFSGFAGGLCLLLDGTWLGWTTPFMDNLKQGRLPYNLTETEETWVSTISEIGTIISPIPTAYLMDNSGRKTLFLIIGIIYVLSWIMASVAVQVYLLYGARLLSGFGKGMTYTVYPLYLAEISETHIRGAISGLFTVLTFSGMLLEYLLSLYIPYKTMIIISLIVSLLSVAFILRIPESPHYLIMKENHKEAHKSFSWLRNPRKGLREAELYIEKEFEILKNQIKNEMLSPSGWIGLLKTKGSRRATFIVMILSIMQRFSGISTMMYYTKSTTLPHDGIGLTPKQFLIMFSSLLLTSSIVCMYIVELVGRKPPLLVSSTICSILQGVTAVFFYSDMFTKDHVSDIQWIPYASMLIFAVFYEAGIGIMSHTLLGELFPANVKSKAAALSTICFAVSTFLINFTFPILQEKFGVEVMFIVFCVNNALVAIFTAFFVVETKGKSLGEIQEILNR